MGERRCSRLRPALAGLLLVLAATGTACQGEAPRRTDGVTSGTTSSSAPATPARPDVLVIAHRGASAYAPHDTVAAAREAVERGADVVEADIRQTADGRPVALFHESLAPTTDVEQVFPDRAPWRVESFTLAEVRRLDAGSWFGPRFAGERVPTLDELADALAGTRVRLNVEVKTPDRYPGLGRRVLAEVRDRPRRFREVESFDLGLLSWFAQQSPPVRLGAAAGVPEDRMAEVAPYLDALNPPLRAIDRAYVDRAHRLGFEVKVWSVNTPASVRRAVRLGVDGIYSHRPDLVRDVLAATAG
ncbi:MAG TPA: glycerophosphodiester phosphodiesterase family protein [Nocardioidaceae bacterium]